MGLKFLAAVDLATFLDAVQLDQGLEEFGIQNPGTATSVGMPVHTYLDRLDKVVVTGINGSGHLQRFGFTPLLVGTGFPDAFYEGNADFTGRIPLIPGDPNNPGGQKLYSSESGTFSTSEWEEVSVPGLVNTGVGAFPTAPPGNGPIRVTLGIGTAIPPGPGTWNAGSTTFGFGFWGLVFEGLTDGILGETNLVGSNVYPAGLMLIRARLATCPAPIGTGAANDCDNALVWLDLATGLVDGRMVATPGKADTSGINTEAPISGQSFFWQVAQYIPDVDATFASPKGEMLLVSDDNAIPADPSNFPQSVFLKVIDYNPFNAVATSGAPNRVHERIRLRSSVDFDDNPMFDVGTAGAARNDNFRVHFHPPSQRFFMVLAVQSATVPNVVDESFIGYWLRQVDPAILTTPVPRDVPRSNDVTEYECFVTGTLGEPVAGVQVDWELFRRSSEAEVIDASTFPGTSTVANGPIDQSFPSQNEGTLVVVADASTLVEGVDYTVVLSTGVITWITDQSGATIVTASYEHRDTDASDGDGVTAHGQLLTLSSLTQEDGRAFTQVRADATLTPGVFDLLRNTFG